MNETDRQHACELAEHEIREALAKAETELNCEFPVLSRVVVRSMTQLGYVCDEELLHSWLAAGDITHPQRGSAACFYWDALQVRVIWQLLESRRMWQPGHEAHEWKKSNSQLQLERFGPDDIPSELLHTVNRPMRDLCIMMAEADNRQMRENILAFVLRKLELEA